MNINYVMRSFITRKYVTIFTVLSFLVFGCQTDLPKNHNGENQPRFQLISPEDSGIGFANVVEERYDNFFEFFMYVYNGGGVATGDINNDGLLDLYFTGNEIPNKLYLNKGNLKFEDITEAAGAVGATGWHNGVTMVDINGDGWLDIYVCRGGWQDTEKERKNLLYINQGDLTFKEGASNYGLDDASWSTQAAFFDLDNDNDLDMYLMNRPDSFALPLHVTAGRRLTHPENNRDKLYINYDGKFKEEGLARGIHENYDYGLGLGTADINDDNYMDIYVSNDFSGGDYF